MQQVYDYILMADSYSWLVVTMMAVVFAGFVSSRLGNIMYSLTFLPAFMVGGLAGLAAFRAAEIMLVPERSMGIIVESAVGMMAALIVVLILARVFMALYGLTIRPARKGPRTRAMMVR